MIGANEKGLARSKQAVLQKEAEALREREARFQEIVPEWDRELEGRSQKRRLRKMLPRAPEALSLRDRVPAAAVPARPR